MCEATKYTLSQNVRMYKGYTTALSLLDSTADSKQKNT